MPSGPVLFSLQVSGLHSDFCGCADVAQWRFQQSGVAMTRKNRIEHFSTHWQKKYQSEPYYNPTYSWDDFDPAYRYAYKSYEEHPHARFEDIETRLEAGWDIAKGKSKLAWADARQAIRSAWDSVERVIPGDFDRDGR
jgi:hypothetical protein